MKSKTTRLMLIAIPLALVLVGCQSPRNTPSDCQAWAPQLEYYTTDDGGVYYPAKSATNLMLYIDSLKQCAFPQR
ncbi:hypothetical protein [Photobacterium leiognathi]|uniref:hypothetical protein n=1 Tax=Photobacterium leiognathi TaxID=553611 RepID=UPI000D16DD34|nr:hypothetical protein [Photobacterium leiognathi]PSW53032.1 hypothetical protein C0W50_19685 [Photobacterium leiognathi subsp. mandapamensis]